MNEFTLAHFSDAHLPVHGGFSVLELVSKRGLSALNWVRKRRRLHRLEVAQALRADILAHAPDHVAMTGDAVNFGLAREFAEAAAWLGGFGPEDRLSFVPGNHEAMVAGAEEAREKAYAPFTCGDDGAGWPWLRRRGPIALIGISTSIPTAPFLAQGEIGAAQFELLRATLEAARGLFRIILIHHPPTGVAPARKALRDRAALAGILRREGAGLLLHGHDHRNELSMLEGPSGPIPVLGVPSASTPLGLGAEPAEWRRITIGGHAGGWRVAVERRALGAKGFETRGRFMLEASG